MTYRPEFLQALAILAEAAEAIEHSGAGHAVLVGGAAVELFTAGAVISGDFDMVTEAQQALEVELIRRGFRREDRAGRLLRGLYHPQLGFGVEVVSSELFEGRTDQARLHPVEIRGHTVHVVPIEDLIADRMGQYASTAVRVPAMLDQAVKLYRLAVDLDEAYLDQRIADETGGDLRLSDLKAEANGTRDDHH